MSNLDTNASSESLTVTQEKRLSDVTKNTTSPIIPSSTPKPASLQSLEDPEKEPKQFEKEAMSIFEHFPPVRHFKFQSSIKENSTDSFRNQEIDRSDITVFSRDPAASRASLNETDGTKFNHLKKNESKSEHSPTILLPSEVRDKEKDNFTNQDQYSDGDLLSASSKISAVILPKPLIPSKSKLTSQNLLFQSDEVKNHAPSVTTTTTTPTTKKQLDVIKEEILLKKTFNQDFTQVLSSENSTKIPVAISKANSVTLPTLTLLPPPNKATIGEDDNKKLNDALKESEEK